MADLDYSQVVETIRDYYGASSQQVWDVVNQYNLTPEQLYELAPNNQLAQGADGLYHLYMNDGESGGIYQQVSIPASSQSELPNIINSNTQSGTAATTYKVKWAGNSVIDEHGNIRTSPGVDKYSNGTLMGKVQGVLGTVAAATAGWSVGMSLGKTIGSALYDLDPTFFSAYNPSNWNAITANMPDGLAKKAINYLLQIKNDGSTQAYMSQDAFNQIALALTQTGLFEQGGSSTATLPDPDVPASYLQNPPLSFGGSGSYIEWYSGTWQRIMGFEIIGDVYVVVNTLNGPTYIYAYTKNNSPVTYEEAYYEIDPQSGAKIYTDRTPRTLTPTAHTINYKGQSYSFNYAAREGTSVGYPNVTSNLRSNVIIANIEQVIALYLYLGDITTESALPGTGDQPQATVANLPTTSTQQDVEDYIAQNYPDLYNNRLEQDVVNPDGTTKKIVYYPVPLPNKTEDTTIDENKNVTTQDEVKVVLPEGVSITLPDGSVVTGDGVSQLTLPPGTYVLPTGTTIVNNYVYDDDNTKGSSQSDPEANDTSTETLLNLIVKILTDPQPKTATDPDTDSTSDTEIIDPNPTDIGDGNTPPIVVPVGSASALWSVYNPTQAEINSLGAWLWSNNFVDQLLKMFNDPMQAIIGLHKTYIPPTTGTRQNIVVGYLDSGVSSLTVPSQYSTVDCGSVNLSEYFGNVFDYSPYTRVFIFLPFIGFKELDVSQVMRSRIGVRYTGDAFTGACLAEITVTRDSGAGGVLYSYGGDCAVRYPLSHGSYMGIVNGLVGIAAGAGMALGGMMSPIMGLGGMLGSFANAKTKVEVSGGYSGNTGAMGGKTPYLVIMRPQTAMAQRYSHYTGMPANHTTTLGNASGYVRVKEVHVEDISVATDEEKQMIEAALKTGVIVS